MALLNVSLEIGDFSKVRWKKAIQISEDRTCFFYSVSFESRLKRSRIQKSRNVYLFLYHICRMHFQPDNHELPFVPFSQFGSRRGAIIEDISEEELSVLSQLTSIVDDPELLARITDIVWILTSDHEMARKAVRAYVDSAKNLIRSNTLSHTEDRMMRAVQLAAKLDRDGELYRNVITQLERMLDILVNDDNLYLSTPLMELLLDQGEGDSQKYASLSEKEAIVAEHNENHRLARDYWEIAAKWYQRMKNLEKKAESLRHSAETYVKESEEISPENSGYDLNVSYLLTKAIEAYRRIGGEQERISELHTKLLSHQRNIPNNLHKIYTEINISEYIRQAEERVKCKSFLKALRQLSFISGPLNYSELEECVQDMMENAPLSHLIDACQVDAEGKTKSHRPSRMSNDKLEEAKLYDMKVQASYVRSSKIRSTINPARLQICRDHHFRMRDFMPIVRNNPFVPRGREEIYAWGLYYGMFGDFMISSQLLIPQIENTMRYILQENEVITSSLNSRLIQNEYTINQLFTRYQSELVDILGKDLYYDLRWLLIDVVDSNIRNLHCHGLVHQYEYYTEPYIYLWWLVLRLCMTSICLTGREKKSNK